MPQDEVLTLAEAAARLGLNPEALRKRLARPGNGLQAHKDASGRWYVTLPAEAPGGPETGHGAPAPALSVRAYVAQLERDNEWLRGQLEAAQADARAANARADMLTAAMVGRLPAPADPHSSGADIPDAPPDAPGGLAGVLVRAGERLAGRR